MEKDLLRKNFIGRKRQKDTIYDYDQDYTLDYCNRFRLNERDKILSDVYSCMSSFYQFIYEK